MSDFEMNEYNRGKIAAHSYWQEWQTLAEGYSNIVGAEQAKEAEEQKEALGPKKPFVPPAAMMKGVEKGISQGGKMVAQKAPQAAVRVMKRFATGQ